MGAITCLVDHITAAARLLTRRTRPRRPAATQPGPGPTTRQQRRAAAADARRRRALLNLGLRPGTVGAHTHKHLLAAGAEVDTRSAKNQPREPEPPRSTTVTSDRSW